MPRPRPRRRRVDGGVKRWKAIVMGEELRKSVRRVRVMEKVAWSMGDSRWSWCCRLKVGEMNKKLSPLELVDKITA